MKPVATVRDPSLKLLLVVVVAELATAAIADNKRTTQFRY
jgi:hypothetical protein